MLQTSDRDVGSSTIRVEGLSKSYRDGAETVVAVRDVRLEVAPGQLVCVFGSSGSGKSTLLALLAGLVAPDAGRVTVAGRAFDGMRVGDHLRLLREDVGFVAQDHALIDEFTLAENVALPLEAGGVRGTTALARAEEELRKVGLGGLGGRRPSAVSGGQRQRAAIARALVGGRRVLLADEPTGALDSQASRHVFGLIRDMCDQGLTAVVCSHDTSCLPFADATYEMQDGLLERRA